MTAFVCVMLAALAYVLILNAQQKAEILYLREEVAGLNKRLLNVAQAGAVHPAFGAAVAAAPDTFAQGRAALAQARSASAPPPTAVDVHGQLVGRDDYVIDPEGVTRRVWAVARPNVLILTRPDGTGFEATSQHCAHTDPPEGDDNAA